MASVLHGSARTTPRVRAELQASQARSPSLAVLYGLNPKTVAKWRGRTVTTDAPMGPKAPKSTVLTPAEEAIIVEFRRRTLLPLDDVLGCSAGHHPQPQPKRPASLPCNATASPVCRQARPTDKRKRFKTYEIGYVHIDSCELRHADGKLVMFLAIDRVSKFTYVEFHDSAGKMEGAAFLRNVVAAFPYKIHTVLTDNGMAFADLPKNRDGPEPPLPRPAHLRSRLHRERHRAPADQAVSSLDQRPGRADEPHHQGRDGQGLPLRRSGKPKAHVLAFVTAYNFAKHLKALKWKTPYQSICQAWANEPVTLQNQPAPPHPGTTHLSAAFGNWRLKFRRPGPACPA